MSDKIERLKDAIRAEKNGMVVFEREDGEMVHYFLLTLDKEGLRTEILRSELESTDDIDSLLSKLSYREVDVEGVDFFNLNKRAYTLDQSMVITLKKYINTITG